MKPSSGYPEPGRVPAVFKAMYSGRRTGVLRFRRDGTSCGVSFVGGHVAHAEAGRGQLRLAERMAARGLLSREDRKRAAERAIRDGRRMGETLVGLGVIDMAALRQAMALHAKEIVAELLAWTEGSIIFEPRDRIGGRYEQPLAVSTAQLVVDASRLITDQDVFRAGLDCEMRIAVAREPLLRMQRLRWAPADRFVLESVSGGSPTIAEIIRDVPLPVSEAERIVSTLLWIGVLEAAQDEPASPPFEREIPSRSQVLGVFEALSSKDDFAVLGLSEEATDSEIEEGYARVASRFHPDAQHDADLADLGEMLEAIFCRAEAAYEALEARIHDAADSSGASQTPSPVVETARSRATAPSRRKRMCGAPVDDPNHTRARAMVERLEPARG